MANDELDRRLVAAAGADRVVVLPTADAFEHPQRLVAAAESWAARLGVEVQPLMVLRRADATELSPANAIRQARAVWFVGDSPLHLRSVVKDTPVWDAVRDLLANGGTVAGVGGSAAALCDPMTDPRGGGLTLGLGLVSGLALVTEAETWSEERLQRTRHLAEEEEAVTLAVVPTGSALLRTATGWELVGDVELVGALPA